MREELKCPMCNSSQTRAMKKTGGRHCYSCDYDWKITAEQEENNG